MKAQKWEGGPVPPAAVTAADFDRLLSGLGCGCSVSCGHIPKPGPASVTGTLTMTFDDPAALRAFIESIPEGPGPYGRGEETKPLPAEPIKFASESERKNFWQSWYAGRGPFPG